MKAAQTLKQKINSDTLVTGILASFHLWPELVEISINAGLDYLVADLEHGPHSDETVAQVCSLGRLLNFPVLIRPPAKDFETIRKMADLGPCGLLLPSVASAADLDEVQDGIYMPPRGKRRPGGQGNRWLHDFNYETWRSEVEDDFIVLPQIETVAGLENAEEIARHEITTAIAVGPYDLSADMGCCWQPHAPELQHALSSIREAGRSAGKNMWIMGDGADLIQRDYNFLCIAEPIVFLESNLKAAVARLHSGDASETSAYAFKDNPV